MKKYPKYKDSGIEWMKYQPENWEIKRIKYVVSINDEVLTESTNDEFEFDYVEIGNVSHTKGIKDYERLTFKDAPSRARRIVKSGDIIVSTVRTYLKAIAKINSDKENIIVSTGFAVLRPHTIDGNYLAYIMLTEGVIGEIISKSVGVSYPAITANELSNIKIPLPKIDVQTTIANFLDQKTAQIDRTIAKKERLIELLEEERKAIINHAVTKGINPNVKLKPSGIEWMGDIPEHWEKTLLKYHISVKARIGWKGLKADEYVEEGYGFIATPNIKTDAIDFESINYITEERYFESPEIMLEIGDILLAKDGSTLGIVNLVKSLPIPSTVNSSIAVLRIYDKKHLFPEYIRFFLESDYTQNVITILKTGMGVPHLFQADIVNFKLLIPPINEQKIICQTINVELKLNREIKDKIDSEIKLLKEYRQALIFEAVTGKIDVRN
jgi:type I restriction enzyme S subunit